jgi:hypothetical protein
VYEPDGGRKLDRRIERPVGDGDPLALLAAAADRLAGELLDAGAAALAPLGGAA